MPQLSPITKADEWFTGKDKLLQFTIVNSADTAVDITSWTALKFVLTQPGAAAGVTPLISKTTGSGIAHTTPASGIVTVTIEDTDTDNLAGGTYYYELSRTDAGYEDVLAYGNVDLRQSPTR